MDALICAPGCPARQHHNAAGYWTGCRSPQAREATRLYRKRRLHGRPEERVVDATGTMRRLQALSAIGYTFEDLAVRLGFAKPYKAYLSQLARGETARVFATTAAKVRRLSAELSGRPGPSDRCRAQAVRKGWVTVAAWDNIDDPNCKPDIGSHVSDDEEIDATTLSSHDRWMIVIELSRTMSAKQVAERTGLSERTVVRYRTRHAA